MLIIAAILKNGGHFEFSSDKRDFPIKSPNRYIYANFGACMNKMNDPPYHLQLSTPLKVEKGG